MPVPDPEHARWKQRRAAMLDQVPWLRRDDGAGGPARYVADELLVADPHHGPAERVLAGMGHRSADVAVDEVVPGFRRLRVRDLDVPTAARRIRSAVGEVVATPNHVLLSAPFEHGGPFGPPVPVAALDSLLGPEHGGHAARVAVLDTGVWRDSPLPQGAYQAGPGDVETAVDLDGDGMLDTDVGHANFIAGVVLRGTRRARVSIVKVLSTLGVCTEAELAVALLALDRVDLVNLSLGGTTVDNEPPMVLGAALERLLSGQDRVAVTAAGNDGLRDVPFWPAAFSGTGQPWSDQVVAVAAHDATGLCPWSNTGPWVTLAAPGQDVTSTFVHTSGFDSGWASWSGTSFAAPYVVAAIAERIDSQHTVRAATARVRADAAAHTFGPYPGLA